MVGSFIYIHEVAFAQKKMALERIEKMHNHARVSHRHMNPIAISFMIRKENACGQKGRRSTGQNVPCIAMNARKADNHLSIQAQNKYFGELNLKTEKYRNISVHKNA